MAESFCLQPGSYDFLIALVDHVIQYKLRF